MTSTKLNEVYSLLLNSLALTSDHNENLLDRGLSQDEIKTGLYRSWPMSRKGIAAKMEKAFEDLSGVPGFYKNEKGAWAISGAVGVAIPVRDVDGLIVAIKIRPDKPIDPANKYTHFSSNPKPAKDGSVKYPSGTATKISVHFPLGERRGLKRIRVTEGELKADIATNLSGIYTISMPGVGLWRVAMEAIQGLDEKPIVHLAYDSDKDREHHPEYGSGEQGVSGTNYSVAGSLIEFHTQLELSGYKVVVETWKGEDGKGIDDILANEGEGGVKRMTKRDVATFIKEHTPKIPQPTDGWVYCIGIKRFINIRTGAQLDKEQYNDFFIHLTPKKQPADLALRSRDFIKTDLPTYHPNREQLYEDGHLRYFNTWKPRDFEPVEGDVTPLLEHMEYMFPEEEERNIVADFMAYNIQNEGEKIHWALLLQGAQGNGKSFFGHIMRLLLGESKVNNPNNEVIHEKYTDWQADCSLVVIEEMMARGRLDLMNKLKPMITQDISSIRAMFKPPYEQANRFNMLMFTNHEDALILDDGDRRYCVVFSPAVPKKESYYTELFHWSNRNKKQMLHWALERDLSAFNPKGHAPMTTGKLAVIENSKLPLEDWVFTEIRAENWPFMGDIVTTQHLMECLPSYLSNTTPQRLGRALRSAGAKQLSQMELLPERRMRPWIVRRHLTWAGAGAKTIAEEYQRWGNDGRIGSNPLLEAKPL